MHENITLRGATTKRIPLSKDSGSPGRRGRPLWWCAARPRRSISGSCRHGCCSWLSPHRVGPGGRQPAAGSAAQRRDETAAAAAVRAPISRCCGVRAMARACRPARQVPAGLPGRATSRILLNFTAERGRHRSSISWQTFGTSPKLPKATTVFANRQMARHGICTVGAATLAATAAACSCRWQVSLLLCRRHIPVPFRDATRRVHAFTRMVSVMSGEAGLRSELVEVLASSVA